MKENRIISRCFFVAITIYFSACVTGHLLTTPNGYKITKDAKFKLKDQFQLSDSSVLDTTKIYRLSCANDLLKFYRNGRVVNVRFADEPIVLRLAGYYKLEGNNITIELSDGETGYDWAKLVIKGSINGDTLNFVKDQWEGSGRNVGRFTNPKDYKTGAKCYYVKSLEFYRFESPDW